MIADMPRSPRRDPLYNLRAGYIAATAITATIAIVVGWASISKVETSVRADGTVIPIGMNRRAQHLEGGVVIGMLVQEGQQVSAGQVLVRISPAQAGADVGERKAHAETLAAQAMRLTAESEGAASFPSPPVGALTTEAMRIEAAAFQASKAALAGRVMALDEQAKRADADGRAKRAQLTGLRDQEAAVFRSVQMQRNALAGGGGSQGRLAEVEAQVAAVRAQIAPIPDSIMADAAAASEVRARRDAEVSAARAEAAQKLSTVLGELASSQQNTTSFQDRLRRTDVLSPIGGIIQKLSVNSVGEVVPPNSTVAEIVPLEEGLVIEARIRPEDMRGLHPGLRALVRLSAYDVSRFGTLTGEVVAMAPDITRDERTGQNYYRVRIRTDTSEIGGEPVRIGMQASISVITGERTIMHYLTSPLVEWTQAALRER